MNNIYKVIWSKAKNCYVVASEIARSHTKSATGSEKIGGVTRRSLLASLMALSLLCGGLGVAEAAVVHVDEVPGGTKAVYTTDETYTMTQADAKYATQAALGDYAKSADVYSKTEADGKFATQAELNAKADVTALGEYAKTVDVNNALSAKADKTDLDTANGKITDLQKKTAKLSADGTELTGMTTVRGTTVSGDNVKAGELTVTGEIKDGAGVTTTLAKINDSMTQTATNTGDITDLKTKTDGQQTAINGLDKKTTKITYDAALGTNVDGVTFNAGKVTGVTSINGTEIGTKVDGNYIHQDSSIWGNMKNVDTQVTTNAEAIAALDTKVGTVGTGEYLDPTKSVGENLGRLDAGLKKEVDDRTAADDALSGRITDNAKEIARVNQELVNTNNHFNTELGNTNAALQAEGQARANADAALANDITATNKRTAGIGRTDTGVEAGNQTVIERKVYFDQNGNVSGVKDLKTDTIHATGEINTTGKVSAGDVSTGTLETTGNAKIGGDLTVNGKLNVDEISMKNDGLDPNGDQHHSATTITADGISNNAKVTDENGVTTESKFTHDKEGSTTYAYKGDAADWKESTSNVTADGVENVAKDSKDNNNTFTQTSTDTKNILKDKDGNTSTTRQDSKGIYGYAKDKDGNESYTKQEGNRIAESVIGQDGKETKSEMTSTDITNTAKAGTITNTAQNVTNEGTESVTNKVGKNEVKVSKDGVDIKAEDGKKIKESVGTASRVVENDKITDKAADSTVTTEKGKGTTFGKEESTGTTNIYGDSIKTGKINANDTTTDKLTAGAAVGADGGRLTVDDDGVKGSYKSGDYTSRSYILANTLMSGVDNGKDITDNGFVGSRTDHYMDGDKAKLNETVKDADGSNVTKKTSTKTYTEIKDTNGNTLSVNQKADGNNYKLEDQDGNTNHVTNSATQSKQTLKDKDGNTLTTNQTATKNNFDLKSADGSKENHTTNTVDESRVAIKGENGKAELSTTDEGTTFKHSAAKEAFTEGGATNTTIKGNTITTGKVTMDYADVMKDLGVYGNTTLGEAGKDTTLTVNSKATFNEIATFENGAEVKNGLTVSSGGLNVTGESTFNDKVTMKNGLDVTGGVASDSFTVKGTDIKIDSSGINAGGTVISNVADGSISEGSKDAVNGGQLYGVKRDLEHQVDKVGANAAAMANLRPMEFDPSSKWNIAAAIGNYGSETAAAIGAFYRPNDDVMVNLSTAFGTGENMVGGGVSVRLGKSSNKLSREENNALKDQVNDLTARMDALLSVLNPNMSKDFPDVPENHWAYEAVSRLAGNDIVQGYPDGEFHGERTMTRYEMAEIIYNALSRGAEAERELVEEFKPELQAMAASEKATAEKAEG